MSEERAPHGEGTHPPGAAEAATLSLVGAAPHAGIPTALYVTGPNGGTRHLLPASGIVRVGRGADCTVCVSDPRVSRSHVAIRPIAPFAITDLGSGNGTFVAGVRLPAGEARAIAPGETFFIGDTALALRSSGLGEPDPARVLTWERLPAHLDEAAAGSARAPGFALLKVRAARSEEIAWLGAVLGELLAGPDDWTMRLVGPELALAIAGRPSDSVALEREALRRLGSWNIVATAESTFVAGGDGAEVLESVMAFLGGGHAIRLQRGAVIIQDPAMNALRQTLARVAAAPVSVLVLGETGVGKDVAASMVHELSPRAAKAFVRLNCASLPEALVENELFGHERGAFTGAAGPKMGLLEAADGGTVFLDEIGDLAAPLQAKLLHVIESCEIMRLGAVRARRVDVRFVFATNRALDADVQAGRFRRDLFHRISAVVVTVPPLRERPSEIASLARHFLGLACQRFDLPPAQLSAAAVAALMAYGWPGNVRELRNVIERAALLAGETVLEPRHLGLPIDVGASPAPGAAVAATGTSVMNERALIEDALARCGGNQSRAAALLGIPRRTLVRRIAQLGLPRPRRPER